MGVTELPRSLNPSKAIAVAISPIIVHFGTWRTRSMHDVACEFVHAVVRSKDAQKQLARTSLSTIIDNSSSGRAISNLENVVTTVSSEINTHSHVTFSSMPPVTLDSQQPPSKSLHPVPPPFTMKFTATPWIANLALILLESPAGRKGLAALSGT